MSATNSGVSNAGPYFTSCSKLSSPLMVAYFLLSAKVDGLTPLNDFYEKASPGTAIMYMGVVTDQRSEGGLHTCINYK